MCILSRCSLYRSLVRILCYRSRVLRDRFDSWGSRPQITGKMLPQTPDIIPTTLNQVSENDPSQVSLPDYFNLSRVVTFNLKVSPLSIRPRCVCTGAAKYERSIPVTRESVLFISFPRISILFLVRTYVLFLFFCFLSRVLCFVTS